MLQRMEFLRQLCHFYEKDYFKIKDSQKYYNSSPGYLKSNEKKKRAQTEKRTLNEEDHGRLRLKAR